LKFLKSLRGIKIKRDKTQNKPKLARWRTVKPELTVILEQNSEETFNSDQDISRYRRRRAKRNQNRSMIVKADKH